MKWEAPTVAAAVWKWSFTFCSAEGSIGTAEVDDLHPSLTSQSEDNKKELSFGDK